MVLDKKRTDKILEKYKDSFDMLEEYDRTHELPFQRKRIDVTLSVRTINKLKKLREESGKPISRIIDEKFV